MRQRPSLQVAVILFVSVLSASHVGAQITPKKIVFVGSVGSAPPPATNSTVFNVPLGLAVGESATSGSITGTIYVADPLNNQVVVFPPSGSPMFFKSLPCPSTVSGCVANPFPLSLPTFLAAAPNGNLWISDSGADVVLEVDSTGTVVAFAGAGPTNVVFGCSFLSGCPSNPNSGQGNGQFFGPGPLAVDFSGNLYVADAAGGVEIGESVPAANIRIQKFASNGTFITTWGSWCTLKADGTAAAGNCNTSAPGAVALGDGQFAKVNGIAVDEAGNIYVSEDGNNRVQKFTPNGTFLLKWGGLPKSSGDGQFSSPGSVAVDLDQTIYVVDIGNNRVQEFDSTGHFVGKGGSTGTAEAQFTSPFGIASVPPGIALVCLFSPDGDDCVHGFFVSEVGNVGRPPLLNSRVQFLAGRYDSDNDGITDEIDLQPHVASTAFSNESLGFTTTGNILNPGDQTFAIYNVLTPSRANEIRVRTESFGGATPLTVSFCSGATLSLPAGSGFNAHCSTPTVVVEYGPVAFQFAGTDGTQATGTLHTGDSLSFNPPTSTLHDNAGNIEVFIGGKTISLTPGQTAFADTTPPTTTAAIAPTPNSSQWNKTNVVVTFNASDNPGGSGVSAIAYSLSGAQTGNSVVPGSTTSVTISAEGVTTATYFAVDNASNQESQKTVTVRIDRTPPTLVCSASPSLLPPNQRLVPVTVSVSLTDSLSGPNGFVLSSVTSNERQPDNDVANDIKGFTVGTPSTSGLLRAERSFRDRVYTLVYTGSDVAGNQASCTVVVKVARHHEEDHGGDHERDHDGDHDKDHDAVEPPLMGLAKPIAERGATAILLLFRGLNSKPDDTTTRDLLLIFQEMALSKSYDVKVNSALMSTLLDARVAAMKDDKWRSVS